MHGIGYYNRAIGDINAKIKSKVSDIDSWNFLEKIEGHVPVAIKLGNLLLIYWYTAQPNPKTTCNNKHFTKIKFIMKEHEIMSN